MQELWKLNTQWDEKIPIEIYNEWKTIKNQMNNIEKITIARWINYNPNVKAEIHGFCDASNKAFAAVVYKKIIELNNNVTITMLKTKTKVSPLKGNITSRNGQIPR